MSMVDTTTTSFYWRFLLAQMWPLYYYLDALLLPLVLNGTRSENQTPRVGSPVNSPFQGLLSFSRSVFFVVALPYRRWPSHGSGAHGRLDSRHPYL